MTKTKCLAVTHSGVFHADEVMATVILKQLFDEVTVIRSREQKDFDRADIVYDVGGGEFDHHSDRKEYRDNDVPYAACGLIWREYGPKLIKKLSPGLSQDRIDEVFDNIDTSLMQCIDAIDNGHILDMGDVHIATINQLVKGFNPTWNSNLDSNEQFMKAVDFCTPVLLNALNGSISAIEAEKLVKTSVEEREAENILILERFCPWQRHLNRYDEDGNIIYVIFKDLINGYRIQAVPEQDSRVSKKPFPREWAGKDPSVINELVEIDDAIFVHPAGFIAGVGSLHSALKMAELALVF